MQGLHGLGVVMMKERICLTMIVKNEAAVIERCLTSARGIFSTYCIHDTGSSDNTVEIIKKLMHDWNISGVIKQVEWKNFGENRSACFSEARESLKADAMLVLDADDTINGKINAIALDGRDCAEIGIETGNIKFNQRRLFSMKRNWIYVGKLHEYPTTTDNLPITTHIIKDATIKHNADGGSWCDETGKYNNHVEVMKQTDLTIPRNQFYLAQSLRSASRFHEAIIEYKKRAKMKDGWNQEAVYSMLMAARLESNLGEQERAILDFMNCYEMDRTRKEALMELLCILRTSGNFTLGKMFGEQLLKSKKMTTDGLFAEKTDWQKAMLELGLCEWYTGDKTTAKKLWKRGIEKEKTINNGTKEALLKNMKFD